MSIEALLDRVATAIEANTQALQVLEAGRQASLAQLEKHAAAGGEGAPKTSRSRKKEAEPVTGEAAATESVASPAASPSPDPAATAAAADTANIDADLTAAVTAYIAGSNGDDDKAARTENIKAIMGHFGGKLVGPTSTLDADQKSQALFYVKRFGAGCEVNFNQDYDFSGDPAQGAAPETVADEFDIG